MKIGFIGTGNMAGAIVKGIIAKGYKKAEEIYCFDVSKEKLNAFQMETGVQICDSSKELVGLVDEVVLSVKPNVFEAVLIPLKEELNAKKPLIISIAAGMPIEKIEGYLGNPTDMPIVRVMPNINASVGEGTAAVSGNQVATRAQVEEVLGMFHAVGKAFELPEKDISAFIGIGGSAPAYAYLFIDALSRAGVKHGLSKDLATQIAAQTVLGSAKMILESKESPWDCIDKVCSPGGTTVEGVLALEEAAFLSTVVKGVDASIEKDKELMKK